MLARKLGRGGEKKRSRDEGSSRRHFEYSNPRDRAPTSSQGLEEPRSPRELEKRVERAQRRERGGQREEEEVEFWPNFEANSMDIERQN